MPGDSGSSGGKSSSGSGPSKSSTRKPTAKLTSGQKAKATREANEARRVAAGRPSRPLSETRMMNSVRRDILGGRTGQSSTSGFNAGRIPD
jgi:hypothetical protein